MTIDRETLLAARVRIPEHVVHRSFAAETVVLNLRTGKYHGLNPVAGRMLDLLGEGDRVREAAVGIAEEYDQDLSRVEDDLVSFCHELVDRQLVEIVADEAT
jgi:hypothetical protein